MRKLKSELYNDSMQNWKKYPIQKAQLVMADVPYGIGNNFYGSNPMWYEGGDNRNGESKLAGKAAFASDFNFNLFEYFHFCSRLMKKEPKKAGARGMSSEAPCMIVFCSFEQTHILIEAARKNGFVNYIPLVFVKNYSPQVLKANMRVVGATEYALLMYRDKLPKFRNGAKLDESGRAITGTGNMVFNWFPWERDGKEVPKIHPAQKPVRVLKKLIETFTDPGDVVIDPCVDCDTEYFNGYEWKRIADYNEGEDVLIYDMETGEARIEKPLKYLKQEYNKAFIRYESYKIDMMVTPNHSIVNYSTTGKIRKTLAQDILMDNLNKTEGFRGKVPLCFTLKHDGSEYNEWLLRIMVATQADGYRVRNGWNGEYLKTNRYILKVHKKRKAERMRYLLKKANVEYTEGIEKTGDYKYYRFSYISPYGAKEFSETLIYADKKSKEAIIDEVKYWDGSVDKHGCSKYYTTVKKNAEIVQLIANSIGISARLDVDMRENSKPCYGVYFSKYDRAGLSIASKFGHARNNNLRLEYSDDLHCYCFTTSTGAFIVRRKGKIHITGNCFGSGSTARACMETGRNFYGFEISKEFYRRAKEEMCNPNYINEKDQIEGQMNIMDFIGSAS